MPQLPCLGFRYPIFKRVKLPANSRSYGTNNTNYNMGTPVSSHHVLGGPGKQQLTMVSTTRGVPSTSNDLKEALCEKIPLHYDLLRRFRSQYGNSVISAITVDDMYNGLRGVNTIVRETSEIDGQNGVRYRGLTIPEVLGLLPRSGKAPSPEAVFWLLLTGDIPTLEQTASLIADWNSRRQKRRNWWFDSEDGSYVGGIIRTLPKNLTPLGKLSIALSALDIPENKNKNTLETGIMRYAHWESSGITFLALCQHTYEEGMEFLATLPAIVGLVRNMGEEIKGNTRVDGDWVDFFLDCSASDKIDGGMKTSLAEFLRLYIATNADEDGGTPAAHVTEIMGATEIQLSKALASGVFAYSNEPATGSMLQCMDFQLKIQRALGREPKEEALKDFISSCVKRDNEITGYRESAVCDPRYTVLSEFARAHLPEHPEIKLCKKISQVLTSMTETSNKGSIFPEQSTLAAPIFRFYGLADMEFNQAVLFMARALGAVASIIWNRAVSIPVERPKSRSTYTYADSFRELKEKSKKIKRINLKQIKSLEK